MAVIRYNLADIAVSYHVYEENDSILAPNDPVQLHMMP